MSADLNKIRFPLAVGLLKFSDAKFYVSAQLSIVMMYPYFLGTTIWDLEGMPYIVLIFLGVVFTNKFFGELMITNSMMSLRISVLC